MMLFLCGVKKTKSLEIISTHDIARTISKFEELYISLIQKIILINN